MRHLQRGGSPRMMRMFDVSWRLLSMLSINDVRALSDPEISSKARLALFRVEDASASFRS